MVMIINLKIKLINFNYTDDVLSIKLIFSFVYKFP